MRNHWKSILLAFCLALTAATLLPEHQPHDCFPENDLYISIDSEPRSLDMTEEVFDHIIDVVEDIYRPIIAEEGGLFQIIRKWEDGTVNAYAQRQGRIYKVTMFGGLARHYTITPDAFAYVVCHETGHHIGGFPKLKSWWGGTSWASNEGQSDYWGGTKCLKKVFEVLEEYGLNEEDVDYKFALAECNKKYTNKIEARICLRTAMAGKSLAELFRSAGEGKELHFFTPDKTIVRKTFDSHPVPQCRMDTYLSAALCEKLYDDEISDTDEVPGFCTRKEDYGIEARPLCWFKPKF